MEAEQAKRGRELIEAARRGNISRVQTLIRDGADLETVDPEGMTALAWAANEGHLAVVQYLVRREANRHGADVEVQGPGKTTPLTKAAQKDRVQVVRYLLEIGANVNATNHRSDTAFRIAAKHRSQGAQNLLERFAPATRSHARDRATCTVDVIAPFEIELQPNAFSGHVGGDYRAKWLDADVVIKLFIMEASPSSFDDEVRLWQRLHYPNVLKLYSGCNAGDLQFFVCKYATNGTLPKFLRANSKQIWAKLRDAAFGIQCLHARGVMHSDLKGNNIVIGTDGKAKVTDFGLSSMNSQADETGAKVTAAWQWVAPECLPVQSGDPGEVVPRPAFESDVYALGMCTVEVMRAVDSIQNDEILHHPWQNADNLVVKVLAKRGELLSRPNMCSDAQWRLVERMRRFNPSERIKISIVIDELEKLASEGEVDRADMNQLPDRDGDPSVASNGIAESLDALRGLSSDERGADGGALEHHKIVCSLLELLWKCLERIHVAFAGHDRGSQAMGEFQALIDRSREESQELQKNVPYTIVRFTEAVLRALTLHRRLDKFLDASPLNDVDCGALGDRRAKCEQLLAGKALAS